MKSAPRGRQRWGSITAPFARLSIAAALAATVEEAAARGVFGVPSFALGDEIYFGNDRLVLLRQALLKAPI